MIVRQYRYTDADAFKKVAAEVKKELEKNPGAKALFQFFADTIEEDKVRTIEQVIDTEIPEAMYVGSSTSGNIYRGELQEKALTYTVMIFEKADTTVQVMQFPLENDSVKAITAAVVEAAASVKNIKAVQFFATIRGMSMTDFCDGLSAIPAEAKVFGGGAFNYDIYDDEAYVFSNAGALSEHSAVFVFFGGPELYVNSCYISGWHPLGRVFKVTRSEGARLYEIDGKPAFETYSHYLNIKNDHNFFKNTLEFPFLYDTHGIQIMRAPVTCNLDGSLEMTADIDEGVTAHIAYGDPWTILQNVRETFMDIQRFSPQAVMIFSCAARKYFWNSSSEETLPFEQLAPTSGFYTSGEFIRTGEYVNQHNVTLVVASFREGSPEFRIDKTFETLHEDELVGQVSMIKRLANFIDVSTRELENANNKLEHMAVTDGLTGIYNRMEIQRRITSQVMKAAYADVPPALIMIDVDNFKRVNDSCGHNEGDLVLKGLSKLITDILDDQAEANRIKRYATDGVDDDVLCRAGRWGGEEFMVLLPETAYEEAVRIAELIRHKFSQIEFPAAGHQTISLGVASLRKGENADAFCGRVDGLLYEAKRAGKNRVVKQD